MVMRKCFEATFRNHCINMQMEVVIIISPHSFSFDILEVKAFSNFSWTTKKHEASGTNQLSQIRGNEKSECAKAREAAGTVGTVEVDCS